MQKGKTNHGQTLYGHATRHKDVRWCCVGGFAFYLMYRFSVTREFEDFTLEDWMENSKWFDIKLLIDLQGGDNEKPLKNRSYADAIKSILVFLGIVATKLAHLGRNLGAKILEMLEEENKEIQTMGNWNPSMQSSCYSTKLPMQPIRKLTGFLDVNGMSCNPRTIVAVEESLLWLTLVGCWLLVVGCWLLVVGCWLLVVGCWLLVVGCWWLVVGCGQLVGGRRLLDESC